MIAPIFWPILGISLSFVTGKKKLAIKSIVSLTVSIVSVVAISWLLTELSPTAGMTDEINLRIRPSLFDLLIALVSSVIGVAAAYFPRISATAIGVAISLSLLPPLAVAGISLALGSTNMFVGSLMLFAANAVAIIFVGIISFYLLKFGPNNQQPALGSSSRLPASFALSVLLASVLAIIFLLSRSAL